jgi:hypothetical protein
VLLNDCIVNATSEMFSLVEKFDLFFISVHMVFCLLLM